MRNVHGKTINVRPQIIREFINLRVHKSMITINLQWFLQFVPSQTSGTMPVLPDAAIAL
jgi:hypothetical protein